MWHCFRELFVYRTNIIATKLGGVAHTLEFNALAADAGIYLFLFFCFSQICRRFVILKWFINHYVLCHLYFN